MLTPAKTGAGRGATAAATLPAAIVVLSAVVMVFITG